ncbi:hypothetical protein [Actinoplanes sp. NPDC051411]|uniref:hypothetical protein n=1 Tax=Actinoplanes sp. NPDC051411 TaxID=3155522 RepID=UPI00343C8FA4
MNVAEVLFRLYRPVVLWFGLALVLIEAVAVVVPLILGQATGSIWLLVAGSATRYWLLVIGILLVSTHLRRFVAGGATRREFFFAVLLLGAGISVAVAILIPLGHGLENAILAPAGHRTSGYPAFSGRSALRESGQALAVSLCFFVSGTLFGMAYHRYSPWIGTALILPCAVPLVASQILLGYDIAAVEDGVLPYLPAFLLTLVAAAAGTVALRATTRDIALRRTGN